MRSNHRIKAASLVEVLVVLAIVATTMVAATQITVQAMISIKNNEIVDTATGVMVQAMEIAKSPDSVKVRSAAGLVTNFKGSYYLATDATGSALWKVTDLLTPINTCDAASQYFVRIDVGDRVPPKVCLQLIIEPQVISGTTVFAIQANLVYELTGKVESLSINGFRRDAFKAI